MANTNIKKVIDPQVAFAMMSKMNGNSFMALLNQFLTDASDNDVKIERELTNSITETKKVIGNRIDLLDVKLTKATALAQLLEGKELTQLEEMFRKLIDSDKMQALFEGMCVKIGDKSYKLTSVIKALADAPDEVAGEITYDAGGKNITGYVMELTDGIKVAFKATISDNAEETETDVEFVTEDFHGIGARFAQTFYRRTENVQSFGKSRELVSRDLKSMTHLVISLDADECVGHADPVPDLDNDGDSNGIDETAQPQTGGEDPVVETAETVVTETVKVTNPLAD